VRASKSSYRSRYVNVSKTFPDAGNVRATKPLEIKKIDAGENRIERDRSHLRNPASDQNVSARTRQHVQAGKERHLIERKHQHTT